MYQDFINNTVKVFFTVQLNIKLFHWNTTSYAQHIATDKFSSKLLELTDKFVELFIGKYNYKPKLNNFSGGSKKGGDIDTKKITFYDNDINTIKTLLNDFSDILNNIEQQGINDKSLLTLRDELLGEINQTLYLLQLQ
jgi:hypothetical protein